MPATVGAAVVNALQPRKFFRYSIRSMLVLVTCLCVWIAWETHDRRRQAKAIAQIEALGGQVQAEAASSSLFRHTLGRIGGTASIRVTEVYFLGPRVGDAQVDVLISTARSLDGLQKLTFVETSLTDDGAERLRRSLPHVEIKLVMPLLAPPTMRINPENFRERRP